MFTEFLSSGENGEEWPKNSSSSFSFDSVGGFGFVQLILRMIAKSSSYRYISTTVPEDSYAGNLAEIPLEL
jgi:hypothetical protein